MNDAPVLTIDGPVGSGKGTVAARVAAQLGWHLLDSGALYRLVALRALRSNIATDDDTALAALAGSLAFRFEPGAGGPRVFLGGEEVTRRMRSEDVSRMASEVAAHETVREALKRHQRDFRRPPGLVADGRDMGTVIFPDAPLKVFLTASARARADRRYKQLKEKGESVNLPRLLQDLEARDARDSRRAVAPLRPAVDAVVVDSTELDADQVARHIVNLLKDKGIIN